MADPTPERRAMVEQQLAARGIVDERVLEAMRAVPRERFVPAALRALAYADGPLPIGEGQTISQPHVVATMLEAARIGPRDRVLDVGAGSGYVTALAATLARSVHAIERHASLADAARARLAALGLANVELRVGDGSLGWPQAAPFDVIVVAAAAPQVPPALRAQLAVGGRLVMPVGDADGGWQSLVRLERIDAARFDETPLGEVRFVPLIGAGGWREAPGRA